MKKLLVFIGLAICLTGYSQKAFYIFNFNLNDITGDDSLYVADANNYPVKDNWQGGKVTIRTYVRHTEDDDAEIYFGGSDPKATNLLKSEGWITTQKDFFFLNVSGVTINPLVLDTASLQPYTVDSTFYMEQFHVDEFPWPRPAIHALKQSCDSADIIVIYEMED